MRHNSKDIEETLNGKSKLKGKGKLIVIFATLRALDQDFFGGNDAFPFWCFPTRS